MKIPRFYSRLLSFAALLLALPLTLPAATFTSNTIISSSNTNYDGQDIIVIGCTVTIDGSHAFSDIVLLDNGNITHSFSPSGLITNTFQITDETHRLTGTTPAILVAPEVAPTSIVVTGLENSIRYTNGTDYTVSHPTSAFTQIARTAGSTIPDGATVAVSYQATSIVAAGLTLQVTNNVIIDDGCAIYADGGGFGGGSGPGAGVSSSVFTNGYTAITGGGGGYAGFGGASYRQAAGGISYGSVMLPVNLGSGGGTGSSGGAAGGGAIKITAGGAILIDGQISANGVNATNSGAGAGAGGSIWLASPAIAGSGLISANGGKADAFGGGGGSGGRIALGGSFDYFDGDVMARGGAGANGGGAGTIFVTHSATNQLFVDNGGLSGAKTPLLGINPAEATISGGAVGWITSPSMSFETLLITSNSFLLVSNVIGGSVSQISVRRSATIEPGGGITADGQGSGLNGLGAGHYTTDGGSPSGSGGGYGGTGGAGLGVPGGSSYGAITNPNQSGSGGGPGAGGVVNSPGGLGGGYLNLVVSGPLQLDGFISANGTAGTGAASGGGSGGTILMQVTSLSGGGVISASGGGGVLPYGGGGGGGRISISTTINKLTGGIIARGGPGYVAGGAGTVVISKSTSQLTQVLLVIDNGGQSGATTPLGQLGITSQIDITVANGAIAQSSYPQTTTCRNLLLYSNSFIVCGTNTSMTEFVVTSNLTVGAGCAISADGCGYAAGTGPGAGQSVSTTGILVGGGGGHGGYGGNGWTNAAGGASYDSISLPQSAGSGGANGTGGFPLNAGGAGGGSIYLSVNGMVTLDGMVSANGTPGPGEASGGGAGGSVYIYARGFTGSGTVSVNGGSGQLPLGGGGGGGRISVINPGGNPLPFNFSGTLSTAGGAGNVRGGAGTAYVQKAPNQFPTLTIDNGGGTGTNTPITAPAATFNLTVTGGAKAAFAQSMSGINNLLIGTDSFATVAGNLSGPGAMLQINVISNIIILAGGGINLDGRGYAAGQGPGAGLSRQTNSIIAGGGGGHGGYGGMSVTLAAGGNAYDLYQEPISVGSGGGNGLNQSLNPGGAGGGGIHLSMNGNLIVNGILSANGNPTTGLGGGGGAGGSVWITANAISGTGSLSANGGAGYGGGGGGGGGRIYVSCQTNNFAGIMSAHGGAGYVAGGAGTVFSGSRQGSIGQLTLDNNGLRGTNTLVQNYFSSSSAVVTGGAILTIGSSTFTATNLIIASNSFIMAAPGPNPSLAHLIINGNADIQAGGGIMLDGCGFTANNGPGAGQVTTSTPYGNIGGGAGHGGNGGAGYASAAGGAAVGSILQPVESGAGGGNATAPQNAGIPGAGGGALQMSVSGILTLNGAVSARGMNAVTGGAGGGAGGSIWLTVGSLAGAGSLAADGGAGNLPFGGGGGGGRLAIYCTSNRFAGTLTAAGGPGYVPGGAGTIYTRATNKQMGQLSLNNGGIEGAFTPISTPEAFALSISNGAAATTTNSGAMILGSLSIGSGGLMTQPAGSGNVNLTILGDAFVDANGAINVDGDGYSGINPGPGAGMMLALAGSGSGAGYGGAGGASESGTPGGQTYGVSEHPSAYGSRGGINPLPPNLSAGGGAIELNVGGTLTVNGGITAQGDFAGEEGAGGGSGGSVWLTAGTITGSGVIAADGGDGDFLGGGGGGGGGRVAVYCGTNQYAGKVSATGGAGFNDGQDGSIVYTNQAGVSVVLLSPSGTVTGPILTIAVSFNSVVYPLTASNFVITTPAGVLPASALVINQASPAPTWFVTFPSITMTNVGLYTVQVIPPIENVQGLCMSAPYTGTFSIIQGKIIGTVIDPNGSPVESVTVQPSGGLAAASTDDGGNFSVAVPQNWNGSITPYKPGWMFVPATVNFNEVTSSTDAQTIIALPPAALALNTVARSGGLAMNWYGVKGLNYQILRSTDLVTWTPFGSPVVGANANLEITVPAGAESKMFFCFTVSR